MNIQFHEISLDEIEQLRNLRVELVNENPTVFGEDPSIESKRPLTYFIDWYNQLRKEGGHFFALQVDNYWVGLQEVKPFEGDPKNTAYLGSMGILKKYRHNGYARLIIKYTYEWLKKHTTFTKIHTIVCKSNEAIIRFLEPYNFKVIGEGEYNGITEYYLEADIENLNIKGSDNKVL